MTINDHLKEEHSPEILSGLRTTIGVIESLEEDEFDTYWCGHIATPPRGNKVVIRKKCGEDRPVGEGRVLFITDNIIWVTLFGGEPIGKFDIIEPDSLKKLAALSDTNTTTIIDTNELDKFGPQLIVLQYEYQVMVGQWGLKWWNEPKNHEL